MRAWLLWVTLSALSAAAEGPVEVKLAAQSLRSGEAERVEKAAGPVDALPLYRIDLKWNPQTRVAVGSVSLMFTARSDTSEVTLRVSPNASTTDAVVVTTAFVNGTAAKLRHREPALYKVSIEPAAKAGDLVLIDMKLKARVPAAPDIAVDLSGLQQPKGSDYGAFSASDDVTSLAGIVPTLVPVIDGVPEGPPSGIGDMGTADPSNWVVGIQVPKGYAAVAPGERLGELPDAEGSTRFSFALAAAREMPVFVTHNYEVKTKKVGEVTVESHFHKADKRSGAEALEAAADSLELLEDKLGPYPYKTFRVVEARLGGGAGGMEFPGLVTVSATLYKGSANPLSVLGLGGHDAEMIAALVGPQLQSLMGDTLEFTVDHEVAHQYFAMLVGSDAVGAPVVDEPLTQHVALLLREWKHGPEAADGMRSAQLRASFQMHRMMGGHDGVANRPTKAFSGISEYAALIYGKAPLLFDEQRKTLGDAAWLKVLSTYVAENRYRWANVNTLPAVQARLYPAKAKALDAQRRHWWNEAHGDEDIKGSDLGALLGGQGGAGMQGLDPEMMKAYMEAIRALSGQSE